MSYVSESARMFRRRAVVAAAMGLLATAAVAADQRLLVATMLADPSIVAPVVSLNVDHKEGWSYRYGISGWTVGGDWSRGLARNQEWLVSVEATPINAHNSNRVFVDGRRASDLEFDDAAYRLRSGVRFRQSARSATDVQAVVLYESVGGVDPALRDRWRRPYAGVDLSQSFVIVSGPGNPLTGRREGFEVTARAESYAGSRSWSRFSLSGSGGRTLNRLHLLHSFSAMGGTNLDLVSRPLLGGSWDALGGTAVYGFRYGEFRVTRAVTLSGGVDYGIGSWQLGPRASCTNNDVAKTCGGALNVSTTWRTVGFNGGIGKPAHRSGAAADGVIYAAIVIPLQKR